MMTRLFFCSIPMLGKQIISQRTADSSKSLSRTMSGRAEGSSRVKTDSLLECLINNSLVSFDCDCRYQERVKIHFEKLILGDEDVR